MTSSPELNIVVCGGPYHSFERHKSKQEIRTFQNGALPDDLENPELNPF